MAAAFTLIFVDGHFDEPELGQKQTFAILGIAASGSRG
jgi:hypothetical protein